MDTQDTFVVFFSVFPDQNLPVFVTLTKTTGVHTDNSHSGIRRPSFTTIIFVISFHILTDCPFSIPFVLIFMHRMGGVGGPAARFPKYSFSSRLHPSSETVSMGTLAAFEFFFPAPRETGDLGKGATSPPSQESFARVFVML